MKTNTSRRVLAILVVALFAAFVVFGLVLSRRSVRSSAVDTPKPAISSPIQFNQVWTSGMPDYSVQYPASIPSSNTWSSGYTASANRMPESLWASYLTQIQGSNSGYVVVPGSSSSSAPAFPSNTTLCINCGVAGTLYLRFFMQSTTSPVIMATPGTPPNVVSSFNGSSTSSEFSMMMIQVPMKMNDVVVIDFGNLNHYMLNLSGSSGAQLQFGFWLDGYGGTYAGQQFKGTLQYNWDVPSAFNKLGTISCDVMALVLTEAKAYSDAWSNAYQQGYTSGQSAGSSSGYDDGYQAGYDAGETASAQPGGKGYQAGYDAGETASAQPGGKGYQAGYDAGAEAASKPGSGSGWQAGYKEGHSSGLAEGNAQGYQTGYQAGETAGYDKGYSAGELAGGQSSENYQNGYKTGYSNGYNKGASASFTSPVSVALEPVQSFLGTNIFGTVSIGDFLAVALFVLIATIFIKMFAGG